MAHLQCGWLLAWQLSLLIPSSDGISVDASFNQRGVFGSVSFNQTKPSDLLSLTVQLRGLDRMTSNPVVWAIHALPLPPSAPGPCQSVVGPPYYSLTALELARGNDVQIFSTSTITLFGSESIVGRSLLIEVDDDLSVCTNIGYGGAGTLLWAPFRSDDIIVGDVFLWQHFNQSTASIFVNMTTTSPASSLTWSILSSEGSVCNSTRTYVYNQTTAEGVVCNGTQCAVGDLSGRNGDLVVAGGAVQQFVTDRALPLGAVEGLLLAVGTEERSSCATIQPYLPLHVVAEVEGEGRVELTQLSPLEATHVVVTGLEGVDYTIHDLPPRAGRDCNNTGEIFNPREVDSILQGSTWDFYPFGDISGKFRDSSYSDPYLPLFGRESVVGRALVVTRSGLISGCGLTQHAGEVVWMTATLSTPGFSGTITFTQPAGNPFADTVITIETDITADVEVFSVSPPSSTPTAVALNTTAVVISVTLSPSAMSRTELPPQTSLPSFLLPLPSSALPPASPQSTLLSLPLLTSTPLPLPASTPPMPEGSGLMESNILLPLESTVSVGGGGGGRRRRRREAAAEFSWSLRQWDGSTVPEDCSQLSIIGSFTSNCPPSHPLSCATGDLSGKHGHLPSGRHSAVTYDPYLPLSGPHGVVSAILLVQPANGVGASECAVVTMATSATPTSPLPTTFATGSASSSLAPTSTNIAASNTPRRSTGIDNAVLIGAIVGGVVCAALLLTVVLLLVCLCVRRLRSHQVNFNKASKRSRCDVELGHIGPHVEPQIGSDQYRVLYHYLPQKSGTDDLALERGEWVTLLEAPYGGDWWRGQAAAGEGWFPKSYVEYVDREAERKKAEEENFKLAAAAIVAASSSFSQRHSSLASAKTKGTRTPTNKKRSTTVSKADINSTPVMTAKFDCTALDSVVIENEKHISESSASSSRPNTPHNLGGSDVIVNHITAGSSQDSSDSNQAVKLEPYLAKYNYVGGTEIELPLRKGEVVSVIEKAASGWWQGVCGGRVGWFPASYVKPAATEEKNREQQAGRREGGVGEFALRGMEESLRSDTLDATEYRAIHTFSSDKKGDLPFVEGDSVLVYWVHGSGWWYGSRGSMRGWFPGTHVEPNVESPEPGSAATSPVPLSGAPSRPRLEESEEAASTDTKESPARKGRRKKWSFKRAKSLDQLEEGQLQLIGESEVKGEAETSKKKRQQSRPRRKAPPPPMEPLLNATQATPPSPLATPPFTERTFTTTSEGKATSKHQPIAKQRKRRTTDSGLDPHKPRRLPPPPPPSSQATPQTPPITTDHPPAILEAVAKSAMAKRGEDMASKTPPSGGTTAVASPRRRPRVKRVKRPATRLIPPPPTIPLPPPPTRTIAPSPVAPPQAKRQTEATVGPLQGAALMSEPTNEKAQGATAVEEPAKEKEGEGKEEAGVVEVEKTKPAVKPKPAHLSKRLSEPSLGSTRSTLKSAQGSLKPPPPARSSSLLIHRPTPPKPPDLELSLTTIADSVEETDSALNREETAELQDTAEAVLNLRSPPPKHPPPPRPHTTDDESQSSSASMKRRSNPPSFPPPQRPDSSDTATQPGTRPEETDVSRPSSIKAKGSQLMRSLKKIVQRSEPRDEPEQRSLPRGHRGKEGEVIQNLQTDSPVSQRRKPPEEAVSPPARPPPPQLARQPSGSGDHDKVPPIRPPPPNVQLSSTAIAMKRRSPDSVTGETSTPFSPSSDPTHTSSSLPASVGSSPAHSASSASSLPRPTSPQTPTNFYRAKTDYTAQSPSELSLHVGDILIEIDRPTPAMYYGMLDDGTTGLFPSTAVEPLVTPSKSKP